MATSDDAKVDPEEVIEAVARAAYEAERAVMFARSPEVLVVAWSSLSKHEHVPHYMRIAAIALDGLKRSEGRENLVSEIHAFAKDTNRTHAGAALYFAVAHGVLVALESGEPLYAKESS